MSMFSKASAVAARPMTRTPGVVAMMMAARRAVSVPTCRRTNTNTASTQRAALSAEGSLKAVSVGPKSVTLAACSQ